MEIFVGIAVSTGVIAFCEAVKSQCNDYLRRKK